MNTNKLKNVSISHGTQCFEDMLVTFSIALSDITTTESDQALIFECIQTSEALRETDEHNQEIYDNASELLEKLFDALNTFAPEGFYFGAHPGDGSDFGFWPIDDDSF